MNNCVKIVLFILFLFCNVSRSYLLGVSLQTGLYSLQAGIGDMFLGKEEFGSNSSFYATDSYADSTACVKILLTGRDKDDTIKWKFKCSKGDKAQVWDSIKVPSNWEFQGFGKYLYGYDTWNHLNETPEHYDIGTYQTRFFIPYAYKNRNVDIVFEGVMTDTEVMINGKKVGEIHQGGFQQFSYNITDFLKFGQNNVLDVKVWEMSSNKSVNAAERKADYWLFGGIYRPVWLQVKPYHNIERIAISASHEGFFNMNVYGRFGVNSEIRYCIKKDGKQITKFYNHPVLPSLEFTECKAFVHRPDAWSPESPSLYEVEVQLWDNAKLKYHCSEKFGFRTFQVKAKDGLYLNGEKILIKGINRNTFWPESGRASSKELSISDVNLIKDMNMNAVRMSHSVPDSHFLEVCDSLGLLVVDELTGWQEAYETEVGKKLVKELVIRDVNHPCIVLWANGNEGGFNNEFVTEFARWDIQKRVVIQPWMNFNGINTRHYLSYNYGTSDVFNGCDLILPTELLHGSYDGGHGAALEDYWNLLTKHPLGCGAFLWDFCDSGIKRVDKEGEIDAMGDYASDGIVGPYREKEASFYTVKEIWSPVYIRDRWITEQFDGSFEIENRYMFTNLKECIFSYNLKKIVDWHVADSLVQEFDSPNIHPGQKGNIRLRLPYNWNEYDFIQLIILDKNNRLVCERSFPIVSNKDFANRLSKQVSLQTNDMHLDQNDSTIIVKVGEIVSLEWNKKFGTLCSFKKGNREVGLSGGPVLTEGEYKLNKTEIDDKGTDSLLLKFYYAGDSIDFRSTWTIYKSGLVKLDYFYDYVKGYDFTTLGVSFDYPETSVKSVTLIGDGPYRVWKNRLRGVQFGCWEKYYNNTITGESWIYPEFKGYYSHFYGMKMNSEIRLKIYSSTPDLFLHLFTPARPSKYHKKLLVEADFPKGTLSFLHGIAPISSRVNGTLDKLGPQSAPNFYSSRKDSRGLSGTLFFDITE